METSTTSGVNHLFVVIATYNERENIASLFDRIANLDPAYHVLVVDDNSPDGTAQVVADLCRRNDRIHLLSRPRRLGYGSAIIDGFHRALRLGARRIFTMDADHSHDPDDLPRLNQALQTAEVAIGSRYLNGIRILNWSLGRLLLSLAANSYVRAVSRLKYSDCTSGFRAYRRQPVEALIRRRPRSHGYSFLVEALFTLDRMGCRIVEVPVVYTERRAGQSKMARATMGEAFIRPWAFLLRRAFGR